MGKEFSHNFRSWRELAAVIQKLPDDVQDQPVMFGDVRGDKERDAFPANEIGTVTDAIYINQVDETQVPSGTVMLFQ